MSVGFARWRLSVGRLIRLPPVGNATSPAKSREVAPGTCPPCPVSPARQRVPSTVASLSTTSSHPQRPPAQPRHSLSRPLAESAKPLSSSSMAPAGGKASPRAKGKRPAIENDGSISPPSLKRKAQSAISSASHLSVSGRTCLTTRNHRVRCRQFLHARLPEAKRPHDMERTKPQRQDARHAAGRQIPPRKDRRHPATPYKTQNCRL